VFLLSGGLFLAVGHEVRSVALLERLTWLFLLLGCLFTLAQFVPEGLLIQLDKVMFSETVGSVFWTWLVAMSWSQALCNRALSGPLRLVALAIGVLALVRGLVTFDWVSGWLPPVVALVVIVALRFPRMATASALLAITPAMAVTQPAVAQLLRGESYSWTSRLEAWTVVWRLIETNPLLGFGPANYSYYTILFPIWGWWVRFNSHNHYLDMLLQTGIIGLLAFCWFAVEALRLGLRLRGRLPGGFARAYVIGALGGLAGTLVSGMLADWILPYAYNVGIKGFRSSLLFWFFLGGLLSLRRMLAAQARASNGPDGGNPDHLALAGT
jgi:O-antigen ligase